MGKLFSEFQPASTADWQATIVKDLKGRDPKTLIWNTEEGIAIKPFYRTEDLPPTTGVPDAPRGWEIQSPIAQEGVDALVVPLTADSDLSGISPGVPVHLRAGESAREVLTRLIAAPVPGLTGTIDYDPIHSGDDQNAARELLGKAKTALPGLRALMVRADLFHEAGATAVEELGFAIAMGADYLAELDEEPVFTFAVGSNFFFEIAKLRAARRLWAQVTDAFQRKGRAHILVRTSVRNKTLYDPYVNLLRTTTESMSAVMGGCDGLAVTPFDVVYRNPDEFSRHLAVNTQLILRDEAYLGKVSDPAAGSWYIEWLTDAIAREAWTLFQKVESEGGMRQAFASGLVAKTTQVSRENRQKLVNTRRKTLLGTNQYPNLKERMLEELQREPLKGRLSQAFEEIRLRTERHAAKSGRTPKVLLVTMGDLKMRRARADFITNFFGCAGFDIQEPPAFATADDAAAGILQSKPDIAVLCSSDPEYPALAAQLCADLAKAGSSIPVLVAGFPKDAVDQLKTAGVTDFIHIKSNPVETLAAWQQKLGVTE